MEIDRPLDLLNNAKGERILITLKDGKEISGVLLAFDIHINIALAEADFLTDATGHKEDTLFILGDAIFHIAKSKKGKK